MFYCTDCGMIIEDENDLVTYAESGEFWGSEYTETMKVCPKCRNSAIIELTKRCDYCGEYVLGKYITTMDDKSYCENCYMEGDINEEYNY